VIRPRRSHRLETHEHHQSTAPQLYAPRRNGRRRRRSARLPAGAGPERPRDLGVLLPLASFAMRSRRLQPCATLEYIRGSFVRVSLRPVDADPGRRPWRGRGAGRTTNSARAPAPLPISLAVWSAARVPLGVAITILPVPPRPPRVRCRRQACTSASTRLRLLPAATTLNVNWAGDPYSNRNRYRQPVSVVTGSFQSVPPARVATGLCLPRCGFGLGVGMRVQDLPGAAARAQSAYVTPRSIPCCVAHSGRRSAMC